MNVQNNNLQGLQQLLASQEVRTAPGGQRGTGAAGDSSDETTLSPAATVAAQAAPDSDVRMEKVAAVVKALADGSYQVSSPDVADKMIDALMGK